MSYVYLLCDHEEHGPENLMATTDRNRLQPMLEEWASHRFLGSLSIDDERKALGALLSTMSDDEMIKQGGEFRLGVGWGSLQLHVVRLYT